ncbi:MAG: hypothetical protein KDI79_11375 [Anaerolineae bacterium]|nr:hypothetical protein [Anaerolineae bacterium]
MATLAGLGLPENEIKVQAQPPAPITVNLVIEEVRALDDVDTAIGSGDADFFAKNIRIDGHNFSSTAVIDEQNQVSPHWRFVHAPSLSARTSFPIDIEIWDEDTFSDQKIDLFSASGRKLRLFVEFDDEICGISGIHSDGEIGISFSHLVTVGTWQDGVCRIDRVDRGNEEYRAEIKYSIQLVTTPTAPKIPLYAWYDPDRGDNFATSSVNWYGRIGDKRTPNYGFVRIEGYVYNPLLPQPAGTLPLYSWWSDLRDDNFITTHPGWAGGPGSERSPDYKFVRLEGYIPAEPAPDSLPLHSWWSNGRGDNFATTHPGWHGAPGEHRSPDYTYVRLEGYLLGGPDAVSSHGIVEVSAPDINCIFDIDCILNPIDTVSDIFLLDSANPGFLQTRTWSVGEPGTPAEGIYGYQYRIDVSDSAAILAKPCINSLSLDFGPVVPLDYNGDGRLEDVYVITAGGLGTVAPSTVQKSGNMITFEFFPGVCAGSVPGGGDSTFFFGLSSTHAPHEIRAIVRSALLDADESLTARTPAASSGSEFISIWHAWSETDAMFLEQLATDFDGGPIKLIAFDNGEALLQALRNLQGDSPDLILGPNLWADELESLGLAGAYCLPGQCPQCEGANPPPWCPFAKGDFSYSRNNDFQIAGLCEPDQCPVCFGPNPPRWCWAAQLDPVIAPDIFQAGFARQLDNGVFPNGVPIWWDSISVLANPAWFTQRQAALPASLTEILQLREDFPDLVYVDPKLDGDPSPDPMRQFLDAVKGDPNPQPNIAGILVIEADQYQQLTGIVEPPLYLFPLSDYQPEPIVQGVYMNPQTNQKDLALDFAYLLADEETQIKRFQISGRLPTHGEAWETVAGESLIQFGQQNLLAFEGNLPYIDIPEIIQRPPTTPPTFDNDACGVAADELYERLLPPFGVSDIDRVKAEFDARQFANLCRRYMPSFGADACAHRAELIFARTYAERRGQPFAAGLAKITAELGLPVCRLGPAPKSIDPVSGGTLAGSISGLSLALNFPSGAVPEPVELLLSEGADGPLPNSSGILGTIFSVNAFSTLDQRPVKTFNKSFSLSVGYDDAMLGSIDESKLALVYWDVITEKWVEVPGSVDPDENLISAELDHLTTFAIRVQSDNRVYLPIVIK